MEHFEGGAFGANPHELRLRSAASRGEEAVDRPPPGGEEVDVSEEVRGAGGGQEVAGDAAEGEEAAEVLGEGEDRGEKDGGEVVEAEHGSSRALNDDLPGGEQNSASLNDDVLGVDLASRS